MPLEPRSKDACSDLERLLLLAVLAGMALSLPWASSFLRPGFLTYDEEGQIAATQALRMGGPLEWRFGGGVIHSAVLWGLCQAFGPSLWVLRLPSHLAVIAEALLLMAWLKPRLGERAALWAALADLACSATFARGLSMMAVAWTPSLFLLHAICLDRVLQRPWQAALWALSALVWCLDYEGWAGAALVLGLWAAWSQRRQPRMLAGLGLGAAAGFALLWLAQGGFSAYASARFGISIRHGEWWRHALPNLVRLLSWEDRMPLSAAPFHPYPAPWAWLPGLLGAGLALRRDPRLGLLLTLGLVPLFLFQTDAEPHRLVLFHLAFAACAGAGIAWCWRWKPGRWLGIGLLLFGLWQESTAWSALSPARIGRMYGRSWGLMQAARWLKANPAPGGWDLVTGLGPHHDLDFEFLLDAEGVPRAGKVPVALVDWDYAPGFKRLQGGLRAFPGTEGRDILLAFPDAPSAAELRSIRAELGWLRQAYRELSTTAFRQALAEALPQGRPASPWARTVAWEAWMYANTQLDDLDPVLFEAALEEPLVSGWFYDVAAERFSKKYPKTAARLRARADALDPRRHSLEYRAWRD